MEEVQTTPAAPAVTPKTHPLATWSFILGIVGCVLCGLLVPAEILAIIFGIIALVKINNNASLFKGKGKAIAGIVLGSVSICLMPIVVIIAIAIPQFSMGRISANESRATSSLKLISDAEQNWWSNDFDGNGIEDYWTYDVSCISRMRNTSGDQLHVIDPLLAQADSNPAKNDTFGADKLVGITTQQAIYGYYFRAMEKDEAGNPYNQNEVNGVKATNSSKWAFVAYPQTYGKTGERTFIINQEGYIYCKKLKDEPVLQWPALDPTSVDWFRCD